MNVTPGMLIQEVRWTPLVHIPPQHQAYLIHPGTQVPPKPLETQWAWHWPLLTSILILSPHPARFSFSHRKSNYNYDQAVTAVSQDHHLLTIEGQFQIQIDPRIDQDAISRLNRLSINRIIKPLVRQVAREEFSQVKATQANADVIATHIHRKLKAILIKEGLLVLDFEINKIETYNADIPKQP